MQDDNTAIIFASSIEGDGRGAVLTDDSIATTLKVDALAWVHLDGTNPQSKDWLSREITYLDNIIVDALLAEETRPRIVEYEDGVLMILRGVNLNENAQAEDMVSIRLWVDAHRIISVQRRPLKAVRDIQNRLSEGKGPKNAGEFVVSLTARLFERMEPVFAELDETLDTIEERVMEDPENKDRQNITMIRKKSILFRRYIAPQRDAISYLRTSDQIWLDQIQRRRLQESVDRVVRYIEDLDAIRERAQIVKDELSNALADKMNRNTYVLSVVAAIFLPLGFLTGLLGVNIGGIPGTEDPYAFLIFSGALFVIVLLQVLIFKKLKWF